MNTKQFPGSVNFHLLAKCNMSCRYCFAPKCPNLRLNEQLQIVRLIGEYYRTHQVPNAKITFVGGEPLLNKGLPTLIKTAKEYGLTTMIVSNGSLLSRAFFEECDGSLDWVGLSLDSLSMQCNRQIGRVDRKRPATDEAYYRKIIALVHEAGCRLKINTVVSRYNYEEDLNAFVEWAKPDRWKILQVLCVDGVNDADAQSFLLESDEFDAFVLRHKQYAQVVETNDDMIGSYLMISPNGRFFDNRKGYTYSKPILSVGLEEAFSSIDFDYQSFVDRGGNY